MPHRGCRRHPAYCPCFCLSPWSSSPGHCRLQPIRRSFIRGVSPGSIIEGGGPPRGSVGAWKRLSVGGRGKAPAASSGTHPRFYASTLLLFPLLSARFSRAGPLLLAGQRVRSVQKERCLLDF